MSRGGGLRWLGMLGGLLVLVGAGLLGDAITQQGAWRAVSLGLGRLAFGWSGLVALGSAVSIPLAARGMHGLPFELVHARAFWAGAGSLLGGFVLLGVGFRQPPRAPEPASAAVGARLYPQLANYRDFYWSTLGAYGGGILASELVLVMVQTVLGSSRSRSGTAPVTAFGLALLASSGVAFAAGFLGAARARRLSAPEATIGLVYFGLPLPLLLTLLPFLPKLQVAVGYSLREVVYVANLLGRPEIGYWLVFFLLVLMMVLGITSGFVATASGKLDLRTGFELFVARRHVSVFRPRLLLGALAVLLFGIVPPLILFAIFRATEAAVDRTRIRALGLQDPMAAAEALHRGKLREQSPTAMMTALSVGGVGVGVMALIIVLSVMSGFEADLQQKILGTNAHAMVLKYGDPNIEDYKSVMQSIRAVPGVIGETPFIVNEVMISSEQNVAGVVIKGIDPVTVGEVTDLPKNVLPGGSLDNLTHPERILEHADEPAPADTLDFRGPHGKLQPKKEAPDPFIDAPTKRSKAVAVPGILIGRELAANLRVTVGDRVSIVSPLGGELGPQGPMPKQKAFRVGGIFYSGMFEYDSKFVYIRLEDAQTFFGVKGASGIELKVADVDDARRIGDAVHKKLDGYPYRVRDWGEMNQNLFSALRLEKLVMGLILSIIVVVAAGLIVATVIMLVLEKRKEISVLKALGVPDGGIVKIFLAEGLQIGVAGGLLGLIAGLAWCFFIDKVGIHLDAEVYYIPKLPVKIVPLQTALSVIIAVLVTFLASIYPALKASRVEPVEGLKAE